MKNTRFRNARIWSNRELLKIAPRFAGSVVNVSAWQDSDKEGSTYQASYFTQASEYWLTNWNADARGFQGNLPNEIFLDLENPLPPDLANRFDVVFNHTTLEHVFDVFTAFGNLCAMSRDAVVVVVPFLQEQHGEYGDYWRFTPWAMKRIFLKNGLIPAFLSANDGPNDAIYLVAVGAKSPETAAWLGQVEGNLFPNVESRFIGIPHFEGRSLISKIKRCFRKS